VISPRESHRRTTGGVTLQTAAAWRIEVTSSCRLTTRTVAAADSHTGHRLGTSGENVVPSVSDLTKLRNGLDKIEVS
jgi:hypothetical protein